MGDAQREAELALPVEQPAGVMLLDVLLDIAAAAEGVVGHVQRSRAVDQKERQRPQRAPQQKQRKRAALHCRMFCVHGRDLLLRWFCGVRRVRISFSAAILPQTRPLAYRPAKTGNRDLTKPAAALYNKPVSRHGGTGRRKGLKIPRWRQRTGSIPVGGTEDEKGSRNPGFCSPSHFLRLLFCPAYASLCLAAAPAPQRRRPYSSIPKNSRPQRLTGKSRLPMIESSGAYPCRFLSAHFAMLVRYIK